MKAPDPFDLGQLDRPPFSKKDAWHIDQLRQSEAWDVLQRLWDWQMNALNLSLINRAEASNFAFYQGLIKGFALARRSVDDLSKHAVEEDTTNVEEEFYKKWGHDTTTGY